MDTTTSGVEPPVAITTNKQVPSTSSIDTAIFGQNDGGSDYGKLQPIVSHQSLDTAITGSDTTQIPQSMQLISRPSSVTFEEQTPILEDSAQQRVQVSPPIGASLHSVVPNNNTVPEFLYQLTKMLTDNNRDIIEWSNGEEFDGTVSIVDYFVLQPSDTSFRSGKIEVHNPHKLQTNVLNRYFRHSKFASFQRQLNYFGFRKLAGKGKMAPCSYVNDATTKELGSLLTIKVSTGSIRLMRHMLHDSHHCSCREK